MILDKLEAVRARIEAAARRAGRDAAEIELVAVTKKAGPEAIAELLRTGRVRQVGENRAQDAERKIEALRSMPGLPSVGWRMIGHLQTNKARQAVRLFDAVDSLDSVRLASALDRDLAEQGKTLPVLVQVKLAEREAQSGVAPESLGDFLAACRRYDRLDIQGLMAIAPMLDPVERVRPYFRRMRELFDRFFREAPRRLSMGMSRDFEIAIEEGATMVRVGSVLFESDASPSPGGQHRGQGRTQ